METSWKTRKFQLIGLAPLLIFIYRLLQYYDEGTPDWIMANCNITLVMLAVGMLAFRQMPIRVATIWLTIGVPMWLIDAWVTQVSGSPRSSRIWEAGCLVSSRCGASGSMGGAGSRRPPGSFYGRSSPG